MATPQVTINRAPVLTLWGMVVAERRGYDRDTALTLGKAVAGLNAQSKARRLGIIEDSPEKGEKNAPSARAPGEQFLVTVLGRSVPAISTAHGVRALRQDQPIDPRGVTRYLQHKFGEALHDVEAAMEALAAASPPTASHRRRSLGGTQPRLPAMNKSDLSHRAKTTTPDDGQLTASSLKHYPAIRPGENEAVTSGNGVLKLLLSQGFL